MNMEHNLTETSITKTNKNMNLKSNINFKAMTSREH